MIILQGHAQLAGESALDHGVFDDPQDQHLGDTAAAILRLHLSAIRRAVRIRLFMVKKLCEADRSRNSLGDH